MKLVEEQVGWSEHTDTDHWFQIAVALCLVMVLCVVGGLAASMILAPDFCLYHFTDQPVGKYR